MSEVSSFIVEFNKGWLSIGFPFDAVLASHCLPTGDDAPYWTDDFPSFINWRQERIWQEIQRVTGLKLADDLEADELQKP